jgi:hypothetical protein
MKRTLVSLAACLLLAGFGVLALLARPDDTALPSRTSSAVAPAKSRLEEFIPGMDYAAWYQQHTGFVPDAVHFGAYAITPMTDTLFIGHSTGWPADKDWALLSGYNGITITAIYSPTEQGIVAMTAVTNTLYIPGADPCCPDGWESGNVYVYTPPDPVVKYRNLPNVLHTWAIWFDEASRALYAVVGAHLGDNATWTGAVYRSTDGCRSWSLVADKRDDVGDYRTYDMVGLHNKLYIYWNDVYSEPGAVDPTPCGLAESSDDGATWQRLAVPDTVCRVRLAVFQDRLLALTLDQRSLIAVDSAGHIQTYLLPDFRMPDLAFQYLASDRAGYLYTITDDGRVVRSRDLIAWETVAVTDRILVTIAYWPARNWIIVADRGADARLWKIDLNASGRLYLPLVQNVRF